mmetsp:Transcript_14511/g.35191  ORF Transcript_14511/g.35191 Transcript_14511/m.35191 type:complete len:96 (+) Transcript_14511:336-623(+)
MKADTAGNRKQFPLTLNWFSFMFVFYILFLSTGDDCGRVTAEIVDKPSLHLQLDCPDGTNVAIGLDGEDDEIDRQELIDQLPDYCRQFCPTDYRR